MKEEKKDYYRIAGLSSEFADFWKDVTEWATKDDVDQKTDFHLRLLSYQVAANIAIAQQLSVISGHLGAIVAKSKES